jgi:hypothetical protein
MYQTLEGKLKEPLILSPELERIKKRAYDSRPSLPFICHTLKELKKGFVQQVVDFFHKYSFVHNMVN